MLDFPMPRLLGYARETAIAEKFQAILALGRANSRMKDVYDILDSQLTTRVIADALEKEGYFFSSSRGSPVICVVGMTVLDIMRDEGLQENARMVGDHLRRPLEALGQRFPWLGAVHGMRLYLGLEFVRYRETLAPATGETAAICDRLLQLGVILQPTGDDLNVLKINPPLCLACQVPISSTTCWSGGWTKGGKSVTARPTTRLNSGAGSD